MALNKRTYVDQETVITAENLNDIQDAIIENEEAIEDQGEAIEGKYAKPSGGIPASDMASGVQTSLGKADTAYQKPSGGIPSTDLASGVQTSLGKADTAYQKPSGGIPSTDLASGVQTSLGKADTALQSSDIDNTLSVTGKAADAKKTGDEISGIKNTLNQLALIGNTTAINQNGTYTKENVTGMTANHKVANWGLFSDANLTTPISPNNPPADITIAEEAGGYVITIANYTSAFYMKPTFILPQN